MSTSPNLSVATMADAAELGRTGGYLMDAATPTLSGAAVVIAAISAAAIVAACAGKVAQAWRAGSSYLHEAETQLPELLADGKNVVDLTDLRSGLLR